MTDYLNAQLVRSHDGALKVCLTNAHPCKAMTVTDRTPAWFYDWDNGSGTNQKKMIRFDPCSLVLQPGRSAVLSHKSYYVEDNEYIPHDAVNDCLIQTIQTARPSSAGRSRRSHEEFFEFQYTLQDEEEPRMLDLSGGIPVAFQS
jgi:hypothetical protein